MKQERDEKAQLDEELDRLLLYEATKRYLEESDEYETLLKETIEAGPHTFSKEHEDRMRALIASVGQKKKRRLFSQRGMRRVGITAAAMVLFFSAGGTYLVSNADWEDIRNFFMQREKTHTEITLPEDLSEEYRGILAKTGWERAYYPSYLPSGFTLIDAEPASDSYTWRFKNGDKALKISQSPLEYGVYYHIDTEGVKISPIDINGYKSNYVEKGISKTIYYKNEHCYFAIQGINISQSELVKVTKNLKMIENTK